MTPEMTGLVGLALMLVLMFARMNIGLAMASAGLIGFTYLSGFDKAMGMAATTTYGTIAFYPMTAVPLFVFMGAIVSNSGTGSDLYEAAYKWVGHLKGGLALATVTSCALFAAICGSSSAETLTIGKIALPEMRRYKYNDALATGCIASGGTLGILIPPSMGFLMYGIITEQSVGELFMAGIVPGIVLSLLFMLTVSIWTWRNPNAGPAGVKTTFKEKLLSLKKVISTVILFLIVLGGIYLGVFTPTEAGAIGALGAIIITFFSRKLTFKALIASIVEAGNTTAMILILIAGAFIFMRFMTISRLPFVMADAVGGLGLPPFMVFLLVVLVYIIVGMFLDINSAMVVTVPLLLPVMIKMGFDPIWFGVEVVLLIEMGLITPPVGMNVFILSSITDVKMSTMFKGIWPFVGAMLVCILLLLIVPDIALFLPQRM